MVGRKTQIVTAMLLSVCICAYFISRLVSDKIKLQNDLWERSLRVNSIKGGLLTISMGVSNILAHNENITNYMDLCASYNSNIHFHPPLHSVGNPCSELLSPSTYCWVKEWNPGSDPPDLPILWTLAVGSEEVYLYITRLGALHIARKPEWRRLREQLDSKEIVCFGP
jgi:hypothetical protein